MTYEEAKAIVRKHTAHLVKKWEKTGLLEGLKSDIDKSPMAVLLESEPKQILESEMTPEEHEFYEAMMIVMEKEKSYGNTN